MSPRKGDFPPVRRIEEFRISLELYRLVDRMIAHAPERHKAIRDAGHRLLRACVGDRARMASAGRINRSLKFDEEILSILRELSEAETSQGRSPITVHTRGAAGMVDRAMGKRWREAHDQWLEAGKVRPEPKEPKLSTIEHRISMLKKESPSMPESESE
ncbi:MAG TPA: hypothetical protein VFE60_01375 [Roseiarcus sp.]|nr:hypothetical protein [Roseiarcus sp.]